MSLFNTIGLSVFVLVGGKLILMADYWYYSSKISINQLSLFYLSHSVYLYTLITLG